MHACFNPKLIKTDEKYVARAFHGGGGWLLDSSRMGVDFRLKTTGRAHQERVSVRER